MKNKVLVEKVVMFVMTRSDMELAGLAVAKLAQIFTVDRFKLTRGFKTHQGMPLEDYISREKMIRAAFKLGSDPVLTVQELAVILGFCNCQYFSRVFEKFFGIEPRKYRKYMQLRSGGEDRRIGHGNRRRESKQETPVTLERRKKSGGRRVGLKNRRNSTEENREKPSIQELLKMMRKSHSKE